MDANELREALAALLEKLEGSEPSAQSGTTVTITDCVEKNDVTLDLESIIAGTVIMVGVGEYMSLTDESWIKYDGEKISSKTLASRIRSAQNGGVAVVRAHRG